MTSILMKQAEDLEREISRCDQDRRLALQPEFARTLALLSAGGERVPARLKQLDSVLTDEAVEAQFDNMPV